MSAHTPGPWKLSNGGRVYAPGKAGPLLATVAYLPKAPGQEIANGLLMTAAPELLAALVDLVRVNDEWNASVAQIIGRPAHWTGAYLDNAKAVIAAATGSTA